MSIIDILKLPQVKDGMSIGGWLIIIILSLLQVSKINVNPWSSILKWLGNHLNADLLKRLKDVEDKLDGHIKAESDKELMDMRRDILDFCNACMNHRKHTQEQFKFVIKECDTYEKYIEDNHVKNGEITAAVKEIRRIYEQCIHDNSFLKEDA